MNRLTRILKTTTPAAISFAVLVLIASTAEACPMCKAALGSDGGDLVSGFFYSILFMLSMPFLILGGLSSYMYLLVRKARAERQAAGSQRSEVRNQRSAVKVLSDF